MSNRILQIQVRDHSLDPAQAELRVTVAAEHVAPTTELRGRLMGPRCVYAATVEVAYPLRPLVHRPEGLAGLTARAVIPEPSLWEPECPFVYLGPVELWEDGRRCDQVQMRRGLRRVTLGPGGLRVNGRPLFLRGQPATACDEARASVLRGGGCNLLLGRPDAPALWDLADVQGFFVLGRLNDLDEATLARAADLGNHPSCLGWLVDESMGQERGAIQRLRGATDRTLIGVELAAAPTRPTLEGVDFLACPAGLAGELRGLGLPLLLMGNGPDCAGVFGVVE